MGKFLSTSKLLSISSIITWWWYWSTKKKWPFFDETMQKKSLINPLCLFFWIKCFNDWSIKWIAQTYILNIWMMIMTNLKIKNLERKKNLPSYHHDLMTFMVMMVTYFCFQSWKKCKAKNEWMKFSYFCLFNDFHCWPVALVCFFLSFFFARWILWIFVSLKKTLFFKFHRIN